MNPDILFLLAMILGPGCLSGGMLLWIAVRRKLGEVNKAKLALCRWER